MPAPGEALLAKLRDRDAVVRRQAARALGPPYVAQPHVQAPEAPLEDIRRAGKL